MKRSRLALVVTALVTVVSIVLTLRLSLSRDLTNLFPKTPEADALSRVMRVFGGGDVSLILLKGEDPVEVGRAVDDLAAGLREGATISRVLSELPTAAAGGRDDPTGAWRFASPSARRELARIVGSEEAMRARLRETRSLLLAPGASDVEELVAKDPLRLAQVPWSGRIEIAAGAGAKLGSPFSAEEGRARIVVVVARGHALDGRAAEAFNRDADAALTKARAAHPNVRMSLTGGHVIAKQTETMMRTDLTKSGVLSMVLASVVFVLTFRRARALVAVLPPLAAGTLWTTAIAAVTFRELSAVATAFMAVVIGVGVDTGVHVYGALLAARREGLAPRAAADRAVRETWKPTLGAACAAGGAFGCLAFSEIAGMQQLGLLCAIGEVLTAVAILIVVPEIGVWLERGDPPAPARLPGIAALTSTRPRALLTLALAFAALAGAAALGAPKLDHGVVALDPKTIPALAVYQEIDATFGGTRGQLVIVTHGTTEEEVRARADALSEAASTLMSRRAIAGFDALGEISPSLTAQRVRLAERDRLDLPAKRATLIRALEAEGFSLDACAPALEAFEHPAELVAYADGEPDSAIGWVRTRHVGHDAAAPPEKRWLAVSYVRVTNNASDDAEARATLRAADPGSIVTGFTELERSLKETLQRDLPRVVGGALVMVLVVLAFTLPKKRMVGVALLVLAVEIALVLLAARLLGARWHVYDALVLPVLLGITLDEVLFLLTATERKGIDEALTEQAPLGTATALTTAAGFGALVICRFKGLVDVGIVGGLGSVVGLAAALLVVPAVLRVTRHRTHP